jgi:hypothetical protein
MFFNPFPWWHIVFIMIPFRFLHVMTYLLYYPLILIGLGKLYRKAHYVLFANIEQFLLQPKEYCQHTKSIFKQSVVEYNELHEKKREVN